MDRREHRRRRLLRLDQERVTPDAKRDLQLLKYCRAAFRKRIAHPERRHHAVERRSTNPRHHPRERLRAVREEFWLVQGTDRPARRPPGCTCEMVSLRGVDSSTNKRLLDRGPGQQRQIDLLAARPHGWQ